MPTRSLAPENTDKQLTRPHRASPASRARGHTTSRMNLKSSLPRELPLVGRNSEIEALHRLFGHGPGAPMATLTGESGVGKSRLARAVATEAERRGWTVAYGQAYPVERGVPYAVVADGFLPILRGLDEATLTVLSRGAAQELRQLFPALGAAPESTSDSLDSEALRMRLYWNFTEFLKRLAARSPLMIVLEDLHWADASSLALLHFVARQVADEPIRLLATVNTDYRESNKPLVETERSLASLGALRPQPIHPLSPGDTETLLRTVFKVSGAPLSKFADLLYGWTRGNPYFIEETLKSLVNAGTLYQRDGTWLGWETRELSLPGSIRDAIHTRLQGLSEEASEVAEVLAVAGGRSSVRLVEAMVEMDVGHRLAALEELVHAGVVDEAAEGESVVLDFHHPLLRETIYHRLSLVRRRARHAAIAEALEGLYQDDAEAHADQLAYHFVEAGGSAPDPRATRYLVIAGRSALQRHADREALAYLEAAVERIERESGEGSGDEAADALDIRSIKVELARARARAGKYKKAGKIWSELLAHAEARGATEDVARAHLNLGRLDQWRGTPQAALEHYDVAIETLAGQSPALEARLQLSAGVALQGMGRAPESQERIEIALSAAELLDDPGLLGRVHRALALLFTWIGRPDEARKHGWQAVEIADRAGDGYVRFWGRWALAALEGVMGNMREMTDLMTQARAIADELRFPALSLYASELEIQYHWVLGEWDTAIATGERAISLGRSLNQQAVLPRLLVWTALIYLSRGAIDRGEELVEEACDLVGLDQEDRRPGDIHRVIPAYCGRISVLMAREKYTEALAFGEEALEIADRSGYVLWALHRILPLVGELYIRLEDVEKAAEVGARGRTQAASIGHRLGLAWADVCDAFVTVHSGDTGQAAVLLRQAAESMEEIPFVSEAARVRRQLAGRLADLGDRKGAIAELRRVHEVFGALGAQPELEKTRGQFQEVGSRAPSRIDAEGDSTLTPRESQIAGLVADHRSDKSIAKALVISPRTVTTHLGNIYRKLDIGSRAQLAEMVREGRLPVEARGDRGGRAPA